MPTRHPVRHRPALLRAAGIAIALLGVAAPAAAHPMGNFSISHYAGLRIERDAIRLRYLVDLAEIPTFQEIQATGLVPKAHHPSVDAYLARAAATLREGLRLEVGGRPLELADAAREALFTPGAGGLPTLKVAIVYQVRLPDGAAEDSPVELRYRDDNYADRAGWKEVVATAGPGIALIESSAPDRDRSRELADYPTDLLNDPPQVGCRRPSRAWPARPAWGWESPSWPGSRGRETGPNVGAALTPSARSW